MARPRAMDYMQLHRFRVEESDPTGAHIDAAGFNSITIPYFSTPEVIYREGTMKFTIKQPGIPEFDNVTLRRGIIRRGTKFFDWIKANVEGRAYRTDIVIHHFHGDQGDPMQGSGASKYTLKEAFVVSYKPSDDLDAASAEIAMEELVIAFEELVVERESGQQAPVR
jgi:phage tail-like protein